jgi:chromosome partitioning protein
VRAVDSVRQQEYVELERFSAEALRADAALGAIPERPPRKSDCRRIPSRGVVILRRIAFINEKGGSGKTTLLGNIAAFLALRRGRRVLAIDFDPQGQLGKALGVDVRRTRRSAIDLLLDSVLEGPGVEPNQGSGPVTLGLPIVPTRIPGLDLIPANKSLGLFPAWEPGGGDPTDRLAKTLRRTREAARYDFVLFDAPPSFGPLTLNVLRATEEVVVPVPLTYLALDGCAELSRSLATVRARYGHKSLRVSMVIPTFYRRTRLAHEVLDTLKARFPKEIAHTVVGFHVKLDEAQSRGLSIFEHAPSDRGARAMASLAEELESRAAPGAGDPL